MISGRVAVSAVVALGFVLAARGGFAQTTTETSGTPPPSSAADLTLDADVHINSITVQTVPKKAKLTVSGVNQTGGYTIVRTNIPAHPRAGTTYRNVRIQLHAASRFVDPAKPGPTPVPTPR
ncbi:MAG: hypothetical protein NVS3B7_19930 [Candidatus Elarobacter sp.]